MNIIYKLFIDFLSNEKYKTIFIIALSLLVNFLKINVISYLIANIIESIKNNKIDVTKKFFYYFTIVSIISILLFTFFKLLQNNLLTKLRQWLRQELLKKLLISNNENFSDINFTKLSNPIFRISNIFYYILSNTISTQIPNLSLLIVISLYFFYKNTTIGIIFLAGNLLMILYITYCIKDIINSNKEYEDEVTDSESYLVEILNNIDKIIFRGNTKEELDIFSNKSDYTINKAYRFYSITNYHELIMCIIIFATIFLCIYYLIVFFYNKQITTTIFITFLTILLLYKDIISNTIFSVSDFIEFFGRTDSIIEIFNKMNNEGEDKINKITNKINLQFDKIVFENISFGYKDTNNNILNNFNLEIKTDKIIGIVGLSGKGKSTFMKLLIKVYDHKGSIYIDNVNIKNIDTDYIRKNIVYVNQNQKLFDKKIIENIFYGINKENQQHCHMHLEKIMNLDKIKKLYKNIDFKNKKAGMGGESMSGGQRQVINIINGLITPSKIVILDEPTNGLDLSLKNEIIQIIKYFKQYKKCIIIISHDKDIYSIFDETINIEH